MRVVVYDDESLEPITVINLKGLTERELLDRRVWRVAVPPKLTTSVGASMPSSMAQIRDDFQVVDLEFEKFVRRSPRHGEQRSIFCFTRATALAMLLKPGWLPGQRPAVEYLQEQNDRLTKMLMGAFLD